MEDGIVERRCTTRRAILGPMVRTDAREGFDDLCARGGTIGQCGRDAVKANTEKHPSLAWWLPSVDATTQNPEFLSKYCLCARIQ